MTQIENDCIEMTQKILVIKKDFREFVPQFIPNKYTHNPYVIPLPVTANQSFIVDWQLVVGERGSIERLCY